MPSFPLEDGPYNYRPLKRTEPMQRGFDVYALQTGLQGLNFNLSADGWFGSETVAVVRLFQSVNELEEDGIAGIATQRVIALKLARFWTREYQIIPRLLKGQIEKESGFQLGNYTAPYPNGSRDCGATQQNSQFTPIEVAFDTAQAINSLARRVRDKYREYKPLVSERRAWELAAGSWNAPAWTDRLARGETLSPAQSAHIEGYIQRVTSYIRW